MARAKKWEIPFVSLNGTACRIDIYKEGYSGAVTVISPNNNNTPGYAAANPIDWQESDEDSLLKVLRYKTGYIRLVEKTSGSLADLFPQTNLDHYVEFYYGSTLKFNGYIQAQSFEDAWVAPPREISLPIISPIGVSEGIRIQTVTPGNVTIGSLLKTAIGQMNAGINDVLYPDEAPAFTGIIKSIIPIPLNDEFDYLESGSGDVYAPCYISEYLEGICNAYGWMVHDEPGLLVFSKFDYNSNYVRSHVSDLNGATIPTSDVASGSSTVNFSTYYSIGGNDGNVKTILPVKEVTVDFGDKPFESYSYDFRRLHFVRRDDVTNVATAIWMKPYGPEMSGTDDSNVMTDFETLQNHGVNICAIGRPSSLTKMILISQYAASSNVYLFTYRMYNVPKRSSGVFTFNIRGKASDNLYFEGESLSSIVRCVIRAGSKYLHYDPEAYGNNGWTNTEERNLVWIGQNNLIPISVYSIPDCEYIEFTFYSYPLAEGVKFIGITEISVEAANNAASEFEESQTSEKKLKQNTGTEEVASVRQMFTCQRKFLNMVNYTPLALPTQYPYMFMSQTKLRIPCKQLNAYSYPYFVKWSHWISGWKWRMVSISFEPWNDLYQIILQRSPIL